ncbi:MAG TPA: ABC transporter permease, partial [Chitinophagaceae bacterium]|nr:ABC transporter permease [Chitinophagaceae bacterium]
MLKNYFKVALRNLYRYKGFSFINILGLAIAITGCLLIGLFVWDEWQYDKFVKDSDRVFRGYIKSTKPAGSYTSANTPPAFATYVQQHFPEVEHTARLMMWSGKMLLEVGQKAGYEEKGLIADSTFFSIFPLRFLKGDVNTALNEPMSVVLTDVLAKKYFGGDDPIGKTIKLDKSDFVVKGVLAPVSQHFHLDLTYIIPLSAAGLPAERMQRWGWQQFFTYIKVKEGANIDNLQNKVLEALKKEKANAATDDDGIDYLIYLQGLKDIHLGSADFEFDNA